MLGILWETGVELDAFLQVVPQILVGLVQIHVLLPLKHYLTLQLEVFLK